MSTTSPTAVLLTAAAIVGAGVAYWSISTTTSSTSSSTESSTSTFGPLVLEIFRSTGTLEGNDKGEENKHGTNDHNDKNENGEKSRPNDWKKAFVSWLEREEKQKSFSRFRNDVFLSRKKHLADPKWMSETIRTFLRRSRRKIRIPGSKSQRGASLEEKVGSMELLDLISTETENSKLPTNSRILSPRDQEETENETTFCRSFRTLQKATEEMIQRDPDMREAFFNGIAMDDESSSSDEETKLDARRSQSFSSYSSAWSNGSYGINEENSLVEEEEEVERLLTYLRFVHLAKETSSSSTKPSKSYLGQTARSLRHPNKQIISDANGYEHLYFSTMDVSVPTKTQIAKVGYMAVVHRYRRELVIAVHYDESLPSSSTVDDRNQIQGILMNSLILQHQDHTEMSMVSPSSSSFLLVDQAVKSIFEETLERFLYKGTYKGRETKFSPLSLGYSLILCGHSLGAALACRLGDMFKRRNKGSTSKESFQVQVFAFGPPPCLPSRHKDCKCDGDDSDYSYIVSIVNNHDCIPRWTESNLVGLTLSLQWTMDRKQRHFLRYHNRYNHSRPTTNQSTTSNTMRRPPPQIPPFSMSSMEWNSFWKSNQEHYDSKISQLGANASEPKYVVPGKVVLIWNHSQDPTIIGAKVHVSEAKHCHPSSVNNHHLLHQQHKESLNNNGVLGRLWVDEGMFSDHTIDAYRSNLELLLGQVGNTI